jgi:hypothetical protein
VNVPLSLVVPTTWKILVSAFKHPLTDKQVVYRDHTVEVVPVNEPPTVVAAHQ